jgi:hypothetical protein
MPEPAPTRQHLAIVRKPYLDLIEAGRKRLELRLTRTCRPPFEKATAGESVFFKQSGGPYRARAVIEAALFVRLGEPMELTRLRERYGAQLHADPVFWESKAEARYASLIWLREVEVIGREDVPAEVLELPKSRSAWRVVPIRTGAPHRLEAGATISSR